MMQNMMEEKTNVYTIYPLQKLYTYCLRGWHIYISFCNDVI